MLVNFTFCPGFPLCSRVYLPPISFLDYLLSVLLVPYGTPCLYYPPWLLILS
ncbi:hypothetical protein GBAR_LOCUS31594 [Geodia barretti]|uniref:Uncharacterized protein n=1 Tax=Geodia barretti TaxID=519541 RepID=A0AA35XHW8_GEOBA|nr:hypothetical protein GBAR_LOCUS31594 [Geodia barretti]